MVALSSRLGYDSKSKFRLEFKFRRVNELKGKKNNSKLTRPAKLLHLIKKSEILVLKKEKKLNFIWKTQQC
jgi:hypothetical protein